MRLQAMWSLVVLVGALAGWPARAVVGQEVGFAERGPRFFYRGSPSAAPVEIDARRNAMLRRVVSLRVERPTVGRLLAAIERQTGLAFVYGTELLVDRPVTLRADSISVAGALSVILLDSGLDVVLSTGRSVALVRARRGVGVMEQVGTIVGRVTDAKTGEPLVGAEVYLEGARWRATTAQDGRYRLAEVTPGSHTLAVRRVGYGRQSRGVVVAADQEVTVDVALQPVATQLNEIVTTVTGDQRRVELGHVVGRINADSLVKEAPVSSLSELLNGRIPGLQVYTYQGTVGGQVDLQVRSPNTLQLNTEPIVIVDGIRYTSSPASRVVPGNPAVPATSLNLVEPASPLNDLNPNDIESIEVVKGPSAATLYGTDAANGVLVITTKRGRPGPARWSAYARGATTELPEIRYPDTYWAWTTLRGAPSLTFSCSLEFVGRGSCSQDSITVIANPLNDPALTIFEAKPRWEYGANVSGGSQDLRYFFAGAFEQATGPLRMPPAIADSLALLRGVDELAREQLEPNAFSKVNLRSNVTAGLGRTAELQASAGYSHRATRQFSATFNNAYTNVALRALPGRPYGDTRGPEEEFSRTSTERSSRFFASMAGRWSPVPWLLVRGTGGVDLSAVTRLSLARRGDAPTFFSTGAVEDDRGRQVATTAELATTASFSAGRFSSRTSVGAQYVRTMNDVLGSFGTDLPPGGSSIGEAVSVLARQTYGETVTLGSYLEQQVGLNQRLFLTGALRIDGASTFGRNYDAATYPKASVSWLVSEEPVLPRLPMVNEIRLRYAFGVSGQQPRPEWARPGYALQQVFYGGTVANVYGANALGNPNIRPERIREHEFGFDASLLEGHVELGLTWYRRKTVDQLVSVVLPPGLGSMQTNLGLTAGRGFEAQVALRLLDTRTLSWSLALQHSFHATTLLTLGGAAEKRSPRGGWVEGYPIGGRFMIPLVGYADANGDGILTQAEVQLGDTAVYVGESTPPRSQVLTSTVGLFNRRLRLSALAERRSGFTELNRLASDQCTANRCRAAVDPSTPLAEQAMVAALRQNTTYLIETADFTRLREVSVAIDLPHAAVRALRLNSATFSLQGRNLGLWTSYSGADPESASPKIDAAEEIGIPQGRSWALRFDIGF